MRRVFPALAVLLCCAGPLSARPAWIDYLLPRHPLEVVTVTDVSAAGRRWPAASPARPQYYLAASLGYRDFGGAMGGIKEPAPPEVVRQIAGELAKQGYLPATKASPEPSLLLVYAWGTLNADTIPSLNPNLPDVQINRSQIVRFLGGSKVGLHADFFDPIVPQLAGLELQNPDARDLYDRARDDYYTIVVAAYDMDDLRHHQATQTKRRPAPLWTTRIAAPSLGFSLPDVIPSMLVIAGPNIGRDTPKPVWINANDKFKPNVKLGELQLVEYLKDAPLEVIEKPDHHPALDYLNDAPIRSLERYGPRR